MGCPPKQIYFSAQTTLAPGWRRAPGGRTPSVRRPGARRAGAWYPPPRHCFRGAKNGARTAEVKRGAARPRSL